MISTKLGANSAIIDGMVMHVVHVGDNGYMVVDVLPVAFPTNAPADAARDDGTIRVVGVFTNGGAVNAGAQLRVQGYWTRHMTHGTQFAIKSVNSVAASTTSPFIEGIQKALVQFVPGMGPVNAKRITDAFGDDTLDVIRRDFKRLGESGVSPQLCAQVLPEMSVKGHEYVDTYVFLRGHGIEHGHAVKIYAKYTINTIDVVTDNPYRLFIDIDGIGFHTADAIALAIGIPRTSQYRAEAAVLNIIREIEHDGGHTCTLEHDVHFRSRVMKVLDVVATDPPSVWAAAAQRVQLAIDGLVPDWLSRDVDAQGQVWIATRPLQEAEAAIAQHALRILAGMPSCAAPQLQTEIQQYQTNEGIVLAVDQIAGVMSAFQEKITVITGGPGTGKTTLVKAIVKIAQQNGARIAMAAPTGRAAKRLTEVTGALAQTVHRLLRFRPERGVDVDGKFVGSDLAGDAVVADRRAGVAIDLGKFAFDAHQIRTNLVIIDEFSMVDVRLAAALLRVLPSTARLVIVGDVDQLPSIGAGKVLADLLDAAPVQRQQGRSMNVVRLTQVQRQAKTSEIIKHARRVNRGMAFPPVKTHDFHFVAMSDPRAVQRHIIGCVQYSIPNYFAAAKNVVIDVIDDIQVLVPKHDGVTGRKVLNQLLQEKLNPPNPQTKAELQRKDKDNAKGYITFREGDKVIQTRNDYQRNVFNGDVGRIVRVDTNQNDRSILVSFDDAALPSGKREVLYAWPQLYDLDHAFALTVHKAQGAEYAAVVIPVLREHGNMLQRNLLYTAITRGKSLVVLLGDEDALSDAVRNNPAGGRRTRLVDYLP